MTNSIDQAYERLLKFKPDIEAALAAKPNESDTRLKVLDRFLFEVLEWKHEAVFTESPTESGYIDYLLTIGERRGLWSWRPRGLDAWDRQPKARS